MLWFFFLVSPGMNTTSHVGILLLPCGAPKDRDGGICESLLPYPLDSNSSTLGNRCGGILGCRGLMPILDSGIRCGLFVATSIFCLGALCSGLYRTRFSWSCLACIACFSLLGGKKTLFVWLCRTFFELPRNVLRRLTRAISTISYSASPFHQCCRGGGIL